MRHEFAQGEIRFVGSVQSGNVLTKWCIQVNFTLLVKLHDRQSGGGNFRDRGKVKNGLGVYRILAFVSLMPKGFFIDDFSLSGYQYNTTRRGSGLDGFHCNPVYVEQTVGA